MNLWIIFLTGLTTGGLTCLAMQGGLLASVIATQKEKEIKKGGRSVQATSFDALDWQPVAMFLVAKLVSHTFLGFLLGLLGSVVTLSLGARLTFQTFAAVFMFATAMNLLNVHPIFRFVVLQPPKFMQRLVRNSAKSSAFFAPALLGVFTIFIPCGITQAMEVLAINTGSPVQGALLMATFVLGTSPLFATVGIATAKLSESLRASFLKIAALVLITLSVTSINGVLEVVDAPLSATKVKNAWVSFWTPDPVKQAQAGSVRVENGVQKVTIQVGNHGYTPNRIRVEKGIPVELTLVSNNTYTCALDFTLLSFGIREFLEPTDRRVVRFTPQKSGSYTYACSMGMYTGTLEVI